jgi:hypothetical protein
MLGFRDWFEVRHACGKVVWALETQSAVGVQERGFLCVVVILKSFRIERDGLPS